ncbi:hypothetical protein LSH36_154g07000 [Paralvinella palmiformis]|uniref:Uncharacterized protein n=1 Tax=Paralvinella palmiformis TaxID=53620 RepID=A0AAD9JU71_9ANNE|nr:hypothetical protein LSH36_154g07000 [Paralvinella palmiformis]
MFLWIGFVVLTGTVTKCTAFTMKCTLDHEGHVVFFTGDNVNVNSEKAVLAEWNPGKEECKFKLVVNFVGGYQHTTFALGSHRSAKKFFRFFDFDRYSGRVSMRGWRCKHTCKGPLTSYDYDVRRSDGQLIAEVQELHPGSVYVIQSELCAQPDKPNYKLTYHFSARPPHVMVTLDIDSGFYFAHKNEITGLCSPQ